MATPSRRKTEPPPSPQALHRTTQRISRSLPAIEEGYRWLHSATYGSGGSSALDGGSRPSFEDSDATGRQALAAAQRSQALRDISETLERLSVITSALERTLRGRPETVERPDQFDSTVSPDELDRLREAKLRREARLEGWGRG